MAVLKPGFVQDVKSLGEPGKLQYDGAVATFLASPGGSIRENFCKRRAGESRLALITFAYSTCIMGGQGYRKVGNPGQRMQ